MKFLANSNYLQKKIVEAINKGCDTFHASGVKKSIRFFNDTIVVEVQFEPVPHCYHDIYSGTFTPSLWTKLATYLETIEEQPIVVELDSYRVEITQHVASFTINH